MWNIPEDGESVFNPDVIEMLTIKKIITDSTKMPGLNIDLSEIGDNGDNIKDKQDRLEGAQEEYLSNLSALLGHTVNYSPFSFHNVCREMEAEVLLKYADKVERAEKIKITEIYDKYDYLSPSFLTLANLQRSIALLRGKSQYLKQIH